MPSSLHCLLLRRRHAVHALLYLIVSLLAVAVDFYALGAPFVAALEIMIYAGAIMVLFVFVVMMLNLAEHAMEVEREWLKPRNWARACTPCSDLIRRVGLLHCAHRSTLSLDKHQWAPSRLA